MTTDRLTIERSREDDSSTSYAPPNRVIMFGLCLVLLVGGFWLMGRGVEDDSGPLFSLGLLVAGGSFAFPLRGGRS